MRWYTLVALGVIVLVYLVVGGIIFSAIESGNEAVVRTQMLQEIQSFLDQNTCLNVTDIAVINGLINAMNDGGLTINLTGQLVNQTRWDIRTALFISLELIATIGFPTAAPASPGGKAFTVPYAIFGIPLFLATAIGMGMLLNRLAELIRVSVIKRCGGGLCAADCGETLYRTTLIAFWGILFFVIIPSIIFANIEPWTYGDAFYFTFTTLATIGFGDMIPSYSDPRLVPWMSDNYRNWYRLAIAFWILLMSAWFAGVLVSIQMTITKAALTAEDRIVRKSREATANHVSSNVYIRPQSAMEMAPPPVTPPYHVRSPISAVSSDVSNAQAYGDVTRVVV